MKRPYFAVFLGLVSACSDYELAAENDDNVAEPDIVVDPMQINFGTLLPGESAQQPLTLTNQGNAGLQVGALLIEDTAFTLLGIVAPFELPAGESIQAWVQYTAENASDSSTMTVISSDPDTPELSIPLMGGNQGPVLQIEPPDFTFEEQMLDCTSEATFALKNVGTDTLELSTIEIADGFVLAEGPERSELEPGQQVGLVVSFTPGEEKLYEGALSVDSNDPAGTREAGLLGVGDADGACQSLPLTFTVEHEVADIAFILDTTTSMGAMAAAIGREFNDIAIELNKTVEDVTFGAAVHRDYAPPIGTTGDMPFILLTQQTSDLNRVSGVLSNIALVGGGWDMPEASYEALIQATTGRGFDDGCDGQYDENEDVPPFIRDPGDAFGGSASGVYSSATKGSGDRGGMGFREGVLPIIILATDAEQKDADSGSYLMPDGCPEDASKSGVEEGLDDLGARLIGIGVGVSTSSQMYRQLSGVADRMTTWSGTGDIQDTIVGAVEDLIADITFDEVWLEVASDEHNQVDAVTPSRWESVRTGTDVTFELTVNSAIAVEPRKDTYPVAVEVHGRIDEDEWLLETHTFHVAIP